MNWWNRRGAVPLPVRTSRVEWSYKSMASVQFLVTLSIKFLAGRWLSQVLRSQIVAELRGARKRPVPLSVS